jgi:hypothetical protein
MAKTFMMNAWFLTVLNEPVSPYDKSVFRNAERLSDFQLRSFIINKPLRVDRVFQDNEIGPSAGSFAI